MSNDLCGGLSSEKRELLATFTYCDSLNLLIIQII